MTVFLLVFEKTHHSHTLEIYFPIFLHLKYSQLPQFLERLYTPVFWPGEFHGLYSPWGHKESDTTELLLLTAIYRAYRAERKNTGYFADAFEELGAWLWKSPGMHIVVMGNIKHKEIPESEGHQGSLLMGNSASGEA